MAGLMGVTAFLSMWINNSAATSIMMPVALAIVDEFETYSRRFTRERRSKHQALSVENGRRKTREFI